MKYYAVVKEFVSDVGALSRADVIGIYTNKGKAKALLDRVFCEYEDMINSFDTVERYDDCVSAFDMGYYGSEHICICIQEVDNNYFSNQPKE